VKKHKRVIFNGNNYTDDWVKEAEKRGLPNINSTVAAIPTLIGEKSVKLYEKHSVLSKEELHSRYEIFLENYTKIVNIEALTMLEIAKRQILPASLTFAGKVASTMASMKSVSTKSKSADKLLSELTATIDSFDKNIVALESALGKVKHGDNALKQAQYFRDVVFVTMGKLRADGDTLETMVDTDIWRIPTYADLLFNI
jgi:glutamine synthetase